jgi:hypothetical protein
MDLGSSPDANDRMDEKLKELEISKAEVALLSGKLTIVTQKYKTTNHSYQ